MDGPVVVGDYALVVDARYGSTVRMVTERERPAPIRREAIRLLPRRRPVPLGRSAEVAALCRAVGDGGLIQVYGPPGIGTSTLIRHVASETEGAGVVYLDARYRETDDLAQEIFEACYETGGYVPSAAELRRLMAGVAVTVYLDNADLTRDQIIALADSAPDATLVFTGHQRVLLGDDGFALELGGLARTTGMELLARELGTLPPSEEATAVALCDVAGGRPLPLLRAAALARAAEDADIRLPRPGHVAELIPLVLGRLDEPATNALHLLATFGAAVDASDVRGLTGRADAAELCDRLVRLGLATAEEGGYRCLPDVFPLIVQLRPAPFPADQIWHYYATWLNRPGTTPDQVAVRSRVLERAVELTLSAGRPDAAVRLARAAEPLLARSRRLDAWARMLGLGYKAAEAAGDEGAKAYFLHEEGVRSLLRGRRVVAAMLIGAAFQLWRVLGNEHGTAAAQHVAPFLPSPSTPPPVAPGATPDSLAGQNSLAGHNAPAGHNSPAGHDPVAAHHSMTAHSSLAGHGSSAMPGAAPSPASHMASLAPGPPPPAPVPTLPSLPAGAAATNASAAGAMPHTAAGVATHGSAAAGTAVSGAAGGLASTVVGAGLAAKTAALVGLVVALVIGAAVVNVASQVITRQGGPSEPTGLAGNWNTGQGPVTVAATGGDSYLIKSRCDGDLNITGSGGSYHAQVPVHDRRCTGSVLGTATLTIVVTPDGSTANVTATSQVPSFECFICGRWTRMPSN
ncbi:hypothetical protein [Actinomadura sp. NPDC000600]|uniref:hypothetical protein n=1 Tax=Actinomadura sp. NPDC000600 TaxID=3154262 RepID=UPI003391241D